MVRPFGLRSRRARTRPPPNKTPTERNLSPTAHRSSVIAHNKTTTVQKLSDQKQIAGYTCEKWVVKSPKEDRVITYWVAADEFNFFIPLLETLNRKDEQAVFFLEIKDAAGVFPMLGIEQKMDGAEVGRLEVTKITKGAQKATLFEIPPGFNKFERN